jgi:hypothetical protein
MCSEDFFALKNPTSSAGFEPANLGKKGPARYLYTTDAEPNSIQDFIFVCLSSIWYR